MCAQGRTINTNFYENNLFLLVKFVGMQGAINIYYSFTNQILPFS